MKRRFLWTGIIAIATLVLGGGGLFIWLRQSLPMVDGEITLPGLRGEVAIERDIHGIVTIEAGYLEDAYFALGYAHAQDRLFQMDTIRRLGAGRLSEIVGRDALSIDKEMRVLGLAGLAAANFSNLQPQTRLILEAYSKGVNAYIDRIMVLPIEFQALGYRPEPWHPTDSLVWGRLMAYQLSTNWEIEWLRYRLHKEIGPDRLMALWPDYPDPKDAALFADPLDTEIEPPTLPLGAQLGSHQGAREGRLTHLVELFTPRSSASNIWAVSGRLTQHGHPLLASDPHLGLSTPGNWYLVQMKIGKNEMMAGGTVPGVPFVLIGHNEQFAWGLTTSNVDVQDLFFEKIIPDGSGRYETPEGPAEFETRVEMIRQKDGEDVSITIRRSRHGPILSGLGILNGEQLPPSLDNDISTTDKLPSEEYAVSLAWTGDNPHDRTADAFFLLNRSKTAAELTEALRHFDSPPQNLVYAATHGDIGHVSAGLIPHRKAIYRASRLPAPGWLDRYDWQGLFAQPAGGQEVNPAAGLIYNANNRAMPSRPSIFLGAEWPADFRYRRIGEWLTKDSRHGTDSMIGLQLDDHSLSARELLPHWLPALTGSSEAEKLAIQLFSNWDYRMSAESAAALLYNSWATILFSALFADQLGSLAQSLYLYQTEMLHRVFTDPGLLGSLCSEEATPGKPACSSAIRESLEAAYQILKDRYGIDPGDWQWGNAHRVTIGNRVLTAIPFVGSLLQEHLPTPGNNETVNRGTSRIFMEEAIFQHVHGPGLRAVFDLADLSTSRFTLFAGQSGHPLSPHYKDLAEGWRQGQYIGLANPVQHRLLIRPDIVAGGTTP